MRTLKELLQRYAQLHPSQWCAWANVDTGAIKEILGGITIQAERVRVIEDAIVSVGGDPVQRNTFTGVNRSPADFHGSGRDAPVCDERAVDA